MVIFPSMIIMGNIKFTGLAYGGIFCVIFFLYSVAKSWNVKTMREHLISMAQFTLLAVVTIFVVGYTIYITNIVNYNNLFYPLMGEGKEDIMTNNSPAGFQGKSSIYKLFYGLFGKCSNLGFDEKQPLPKVKIPFTVSFNEVIVCIRSRDTRIGGFGIVNNYNFQGIFFNIEDKKINYDILYNEEVCGDLTLYYDIIEYYEN